MTGFDQLVGGFAVALSWKGLLYCFIGCLWGTIVGVLPGLGPLAGMTLLLPLTFGLEPSIGIIMLTGIFYGAMYGGSTTAILMNIPGEVASVVTTMDGFAMTKQGRAGEALAIAGIGSYIAGIGGTIALAFIGPSIANIALAFAPPEYFGLVIFSMVALVSFSGDSGNVKLRAQNGPVSVHLAGSYWVSGSLDASTQNGPLSLKLPAGYRSGVVVDSDGHGPVSCRAEACRAAIRARTTSSNDDGDDDWPRHLELGSGPAMVHLATVNGPVSIKEQ